MDVTTNVRVRRTAMLAATMIWLTACTGSTEPDPVASITLSAAATTLLVGPTGGQSVQFAAIATTSKGATRTDVVPVWSTTTPAMVSVSATGLVTALQSGAANVTATVGTVSGSAGVTILPVPVASITLDLDSILLSVGPAGAGTQQLAAVTRDSTAAILIGRQIAWTSTTPGVATVDGMGLVTAVSGGDARIIAQSEGRSDSLIARVSQTDSLPSSIDISVNAAQWTQGVQDDTGGIPMISGGRSGVLNVLLSATQTVSTPSQLVLRILDDAGSLVRSDTQYVVVPTGVVPTMSSPTAQFLLPSTALRPGRRWEVIRDPKGVLSDGSSANDIFPRSAPDTLRVVDVPVLRLRFVPITLTSHANATGAVTGPMLTEYLRIVRQLHPHGVIDAQVADPLSSALIFGSGSTGGASGFWTSLLFEIDLARLADAVNVDAYWIGVVAPPSGFTFVTFGGFGYIPPDGATFGPSTRTNALVNAGWFSRESQSRELVAHELGHNFGRRHAPCGGAGGPDPLFPRPTGTVGPGGHDVRAWELGITTGAAPINESVGDIMGYCSPVWASRYTYEGVLAFRGFATPIAFKTPVAAARSIVVRGRDASGGMILEPVIALDGMAVTSAEIESGPYSAEGFSVDGVPLFRRSFGAATLDHDDQVRPFSVLIPMDPTTERALASVVVRGPGGVARRSTDVRPSLAAPSREPTTIRSSAGLTIACPDSGTAAIIVRDGVSGRMIASATGATMTLRVATGRQLDISCSDGVRTTMTRVTAN